MEALQRRHLRRIEALRSITVVITDPREVRAAGGESYTVYSILIHSRRCVAAFWLRQSHFPYGTPDKRVVAALSGEAPKQLQR